MRLAFARTRHAALAGSAALALFLAACAPTAPERPAAPAGPDDQGEFARRRITPEGVSATVLRRLPLGNSAAVAAAGVSPVAWRNLTVVVQGTSVEASNGQIEFSTTALRFVNLNNGLVQRAAQLSKYDTDYGTTYSLMWRGLIDLKRQEVAPRTAVTRPVIEVKNVARFDTLPTDLAREFRADYTTGLEAQTSGLLPVDFTCRTSRRLPAANLHPRMQGDALELECRLRADNAVQSASRWAVLLSYGVAIEVFEQRGRVRTENRISEFAARS